MSLPTSAALLLLCLGCRDPWGPVADREALWWGPTAALQQATGIALVELPHGESIGYWPRLVLRPDGIGFDNRAWALSLPDDLLRDTEPDALLFDEPVIQSLQQGYPDAAEQKGALLLPLYDRFVDQRERLREFGEAHGLDFPQTVVVVPDVDTPWSTVSASLYTLGQGSYLSEFSIAGAHGGRLRSAVASHADYGGCSLILVPKLDADGLRLPVPGLPPLAGPGGACPLSSAAAVATLAALQGRCAPLWAEAHQQAADRIRAAGAQPYRPLPDPAELCISLWPSIDGSLPAGAVLPVLASITGAGPVLGLGTLIMVGRDAPPGCAHAVEPQALGPEALALMCGLAAVRSDADARLRPPGCFGLLGLDAEPGRRRLPAVAGIEPVSAEVVAAFPEFAAAEDHSRALARDAMERRYGSRPSAPEAP